MPHTVEHDVYPEMRAGGYCRVDHRMQFITRVNALLRPDMVVLDFGAGRGKWHTDPVPLRRWLGDLRGRCARVIGVDIDAAVLDNPQLDERLLLAPGAALPLADGSIDMITAFSVLEHVEDAAATAAEFTRVLRPGGWICAWTPNRWGYVGVGARLVPDRLRDRLLRRLEPRREAADSFPPLYRMNTRRTLRRLFPAGRFAHCGYTWNGQPFYHFDNAAVATGWRLLFAVLPAPLRGFHMIFLQKR